jgi:hypothetical protein
MPMDARGMTSWLGPKTVCAGVRLHMLIFGSVELLAWAKEQGCPWTVQTSARTAAGGRVEVLQWARAHHCPGTCARPHLPL